MSIDPQVLRSESHRAVGSVLQRDAGVLIERWCRRAVEEQPNAARAHEEVLRDSLPAFLWALGRSLAAGDDRNGSGHQAPALEHGEQRWQNGWSLPEVIRDYQILRLVIIEYLEEALERPLRGREIMAIGLALDEAISVSVGMYVSAREEHTRVQAKALRDADTRKDEFLAILAHELRNSLAPLLNSVEVLGLLGSTDGVAVQIKDVVERQVRQMVRLVDDLLDLSRVSLGKVELRKERHALASIVAQAIETSGPLIDALHHKLSVNLPNEPLWLEADQARLVQVIANLLNNAAKYTDPGGMIVLAGERHGQEAVIRVRDTGVGIAPEMLNTVFELFTQADQSAGRGQGGLGIGLALVRRLVEMHGGRVTAHSSGPGQGSEFIVRLPAAAEAHGAATANTPPRNHQAPQRHVLIVEDNSDGRETLAMLLVALGHRVDTAKDGPQGIARAMAVRPQAALIDLGLPGLDGYEVARQVRAGLGDQVVLIALTGHGQSEHRQRTSAAGFDAHLVKPVNVEELSRLLEKLPGAKP